VLSLLTQSTQSYLCYSNHERYFKPGFAWFIIMVQ